MSERKQPVPGHVRAGRKPSADTASESLPDRLRVNSCRYSEETEDQSSRRRIAVELEAADEIERLRTALQQLAAPYSTPPGTGRRCAEHVNAEFQRRMDLAYGVLITGAVGTGSKT